MNLSWSGVPSSRGWFGRWDRGGQLALALAVLLGCGRCGIEEEAVGSLDAGSLPEASVPAGRYDRCGNGLDDDGDGEVDEDCYCAGAERQRCFGGSVSEAGRGACGWGEQRCDAAMGEFGRWGTCTDYGEAQPEACNGVDDDCDGAVDEGCSCSAGQERPCEGPSAGACEPGVQRCGSDGTWGACEGRVGPRAEVCGNGEDDDCNGVVDDPGYCECAPIPEVCGNGEDDDCDGEIDESGCVSVGRPSDDAGVSMDGGAPAPVWCPEPPRYLWDRVYVGSSGGPDTINDVDIGDDGSIFATGFVNGDIDFGGGLRTLEGYPTGFVLKLDSDGSYLWERTFGRHNSRSGGVEPSSILLIPSGDIVIGGSFKGFVDLGGGPRMAKGPLGNKDWFVIKMDMLGNYRWDWVGRGDGNDKLASIGFDRHGNVFAAGSFKDVTPDFSGTSESIPENSMLVKLDPNGSYQSHSFWYETVWSQTNDMAVGHDGHVVMVGSIVNPPDAAFEKAAFVLMLDRDGSYRWDHVWIARGRRAQTEGTSVAYTTDGGVVVGGQILGNTELDIGGDTWTGPAGVIVKYDSDGDYQWSKIWMGGVMWILDIAVAPDGGFLLAGGFDGSVDFGGGVRTSYVNSDGLSYAAGFLVKLDPNGGYQWDLTWSRPMGEARAKAVALDPSEGSIVVGGAFGGRVDFGGGPHGVPSALSFGDAFLVKLICE